ncbi:hypothetical protein HMI49_30735 [Corallococcus exercitus]|uniref:Uncharacterized protein n=1 Tax=Corallococcus exercitus TaxID=2316736 RepID=A0A7Y4NVQ3_9BACT|nr:hypothetical protein [Corallococcus exercitus]NOK37583.1 hypothetical protein [Corallococcus exercitus]
MTVPTSPVMARPKAQFSIPVVPPPQPVTQNVVKLTPTPPTVTGSPPPKLITSPALKVVTQSPSSLPPKVEPKPPTPVPMVNKISASVELAGSSQPALPTETNKSSAVPKEQMDAFIDGLVALRPEVGFPLFTICDNNSFHTTGYLWGFYAVKALKARGKLDGPVVILNFDSHSDAGSQSARFVASDRWGGMLVNAIKAEGVPGGYLSTFNHIQGKGNHFVCAGGTVGAAPAKPTIGAEVLAIPNMVDREARLREIFSEFWKQVKDHFGAPIKYVFFTIDRDVLRNSFTQWGDGAINGPTDLIPYLRAALGPLLVGTESQPATAKLIGFDITGMPETRQRIDGRKPADGFESPAKVWDDMRAELTSMREFAATLPTPDSAPLNNVIFFSGSVSYTATAAFQSLPLETADCSDYVSTLSTLLKGPVAKDPWTYLLCRQRPPIYNHGWKPFSLYRVVNGVTPAKRGPIMTQLGDPTPVGGFACTASVTDANLMSPNKVVLVADMVEKRGAFVEYHPDVH